MVEPASEGRPFPPSELARRRADVCRRLAAEGLDACVVLAPETQLWLCGAGLVHQRRSPAGPRPHGGRRARGARGLGRGSPACPRHEHARGHPLVPRRRRRPCGSVRRRRQRAGAERAAGRLRRRLTRDAACARYRSRAGARSGRNGRLPGAAHRGTHGEVGGRALEITRTSTQRIVPGSTFVLHACLLDEAESLGVLVGGTYAVTEHSVEQLAGAGAVELLSV